eukprot:3700825-Rhodomonas_salina.1
MQATTPPVQKCTSSKALAFDFEGMTDLLCCAVLLASGVWRRMAAYGGPRVCGVARLWCTALTQAAYCGPRCCYSRQFSWSSPLSNRSC